VKSAYAIASHRPLQGLVAFVRAVAAMKSFGGCKNALHMGQPVSCQQLDRAEDRVHPGEGGA
jgi:hypothetical protein